MGCRVALGGYQPRAIRHGPSSFRRRISPAARARGEPTPDDFKLVETAVPEPGPSQMLLRTASLDINEGKHAEEGLGESKERFRGTFENAAVGIARLNGQGRCVRGNE